MPVFQQKTNILHAEIPEALQKACSGSVLLARLLYGRGIKTAEEAEAFLSPGLHQLHDPWLLPDMKPAVLRIQQAIVNQEQICVYGDYDADGICATAILVDCLQDLGAQVQSYIPSRHEEGYGMHVDAVERLHEAGVSLIVTVDNGISAVEEIALCTQLGVDVVVTDHHQCPPNLPVCTAIVNPNRPDAQYPFKELCGAGVAWKLAQALGGNTARYLAVCALATVADIVPLISENRVIVSAGLPLVQENLGMRELALASGVGAGRLSSEALAFALAPRINAAGRMGDASRALKLLLSNRPEEARTLAAELHAENAKRQQEERRIFESALRMLNEEDTASMRAILLYAPEWNPGILGIVASKLVERYHRPVLLFHQQGTLLSGSCRSIPGVDLFRALQQCEQFFIRFGGHAQAAGITMEEQNFPAFAAAFNTYLKENIPAQAYVHTAWYDLPLRFADIHPHEVELLNLLMPFGEQNPRPVFRADGVSFKDIQRIGASGAHLRAVAKQGGREVQMVAFSKGDQAETWASGEVALLYTLDINEWQGKSRLQMQAVSVNWEPGYVRAPAAVGQSDNMRFYDAFFRNVLYNGYQIKKLPQIALNDALETLENDIAGTLFLCPTQDGARSLWGILNEHGWNGYVTPFMGELPDGCNSMHALLAAPNLMKLQAKQYRQVFVLGMEEVVTFLPWPENAFWVKTDMEDAFLAPLARSREEMGKYYSVCKGALADGPAPYGPLLAKYFKKCYDTAYLALLAFVELGFLQVNLKNDTLALQESTARRSLYESTLYALVNHSE
ncbi:single-stranded-DNA-specific exonuclease RecJ [Christensenellaceae bacterium OttesenSCG-928-L17]|nr:single-stranded-DNA-specific exonuclease RecJ [Christensenellaceae bacterium OttesenSCG-928-L17]